MRATMFLVLVASCMPYVVPPVTGDIGARIGDVQGSRAGVHVDVGVDPMTVIDTQFHRGWDGSIAGSYDRLGNDNVWGATIAGGPVLFPWGDDPESATVNRLLPQAVGRWTTDGLAAGLRIALEHAVFTDSRKQAHPDGGSYGEGAIGVFLEADANHDDTRTGWAITFGVTLRSPFLIGLACCIH